MPVSFSDAVADAIVGSACALLAASDDATRWINSLYGADADFGNIARSLRKSVCNESAPSGNYGTPPPFTGVQCDCARYRVRAQGTFTDTFGNTGRPYSFPSQFIRGPLSSSTVELGPGGQQDLRWTYECKGSNSSQYPACGSVQTFSRTTNTTSPPAAVTSMEIFVVEAPDGDDCGDPPGPPPGPYSDFQQTINITYEDNTQTTINEDVDTTIFAPFVGIGGAIFAPITVSGNDFNLVGTLQLKPEIKVELSADLPDIGFGDRENPSPSPLPGVEMPPNPRDSRRIIGAVVTATVIDETRFTQILQGTNPDIFVPRLGNISFYVATEQGDAWTADEPIKNLRQFIPTPTPIGAVDVAVTAEPNVTLDVKPVYADLRGLSA